MKPIFKILFLLTLIAGVSCEKTLDFEPEATISKIVFYSNLQTDSIISCDIGLSYAIFQKQYYPSQIKNAEVKLYEDDIFLEDLTYLDPPPTDPYDYSELFLSKYISSGMVPNPSSEYRIEVSVPSYPSIQSSTSFPTEVNITKVDTQINVIQETGLDYVGDSEWIYEYKVLNTEISFQDPPEEENYYRLIVDQQYGMYAGDKSIPYDNSLPILLSSNHITWFNSNDPLLNTSEEEGFIDPYSGNEYNIFSDEIINGKNYELSFELGLGVEIDTSYHEFFHYNIQLQTISEEYYTYLQSYAKHKMVDGDFFSEPVIVYSNVDNGLGVFGAINSSLAKIQFGEYPVEGVYYEDEYNYWRDY